MAIFKCTRGWVGTFSVVPQRSTIVRDEVSGANKTVPGRGIKLKAIRTGPNEGYVDTDHVSETVMLTAMDFWGEKWPEELDKRIEMLGIGLVKVKDNERNSVIKPEMGKRAVIKQARSLSPGRPAQTTPVKTASTSRTTGQATLSKGR